MPKTPFRAILFLSLFLSVDAAAQLPLHFGVKVGASFANLAGLQAEGFDKSMRSGVTGGLSLAYPFSQQLAVQAEWNYTKKGGTLSSRVEPHDVSFELGYLEVPVLVRFTPASAMGFAPYVAAGPSFGLNFDAQGVTETDAGRSRHDISARINNTDFALVLAGGLITAIGITFDARYALGVRHVGPAVSLTDTVRNNVFAFTVGYALTRR